MTSRRAACRPWSPPTSLARGLDIEDVDVVVHYDPPEDHKAYVHRSGRIGPCGRQRSSRNVDPLEPGPRGRTYPEDVSVSRCPSSRSSPTIRGWPILRPGYRTREPLEHRFLTSDITITMCDSLCVIRTAGQSRRLCVRQELGPAGRRDPTNTVLSGQK